MQHATISWTEPELAQLVTKRLEYCSGGALRGFGDLCESTCDGSSLLDENLEKAHVILLLISSDFLASEYCYDVEMKRGLARHDAGEATVVPIILRDCKSV